MNEIIRRLLLAISIPLALTSYFIPTGYLGTLEPIDWRYALGYGSEKIVRELRQQDPELDDVATRKLLENLLVQRNSNSLLEFDGEAWDEVYREVSATSRNGGTSPAWQSRRAPDEFNHRVYFREAELESLGLPLTPGVSSTVRYIRVGPESAMQYLVYTLPQYVDVRFAPVHLAYPLRSVGWLSLAIAAFGYAWIPWPRIPAQGIIYAGPVPIFFSDLVGCLLYGMFLAVWLGVTNQVGGIQNDPAGWLVFGLIMWGFAASGLIILGVAAWHAAKQVEILDNRLVSRTMLGTAEAALADVVALRMVHRELTGMKWMRLFGFLVGFLNSRAFGPALLMRTEQDQLQIVLRNGQTISFAWLTIEQAAPLARALRSAGVTIEDSIDSWLETESEDSVFTSPGPIHARGLLAIQILLTLLALGLAAQGIAAFPPADSRPLTIARTLGGSLFCANKLR